MFFNCAIILTVGLKILIFFSRTAVAFCSLPPSLSQFLSFMFVPHRELFYFRNVQGEVLISTAV